MTTIDAIWFGRMDFETLLLKKPTLSELQIYRFRLFH